MLIKFSMQIDYRQYATIENSQVFSMIQDENDEIVGKRYVLNV